MDSLVLGLRVALSLAAVLGLIWYLGRRVAGTSGARKQRSMPLTVIGRQSLGKGASVALVEVAGRVLLLGVGDQGVRVLTEIEPAADGAGRVVPGALAGPDPDALGVELRRELDLAELQLLAVDRAAVHPADADALRAVDAAGAERLAGLAGLAGRAATASAREAGSPRGALHGSILSPTTWRRAVDVVQQRTVRR
ncbi:FliO/MopB family protein [Pengzhenrongella sicca]|uniref:Flagellar biosynthetic protein FliO n=1 Tax=Pengzhenrongella sicca TaxID=2819238 RepID=A0A8A4ZD59_9MICO|nr:flagellar biosynthetic protein FliO [Pengzhenrongella sicca]QTE29882.1 flagellar biosynthetic protein FliO [Pengzhenrongella sicca]